MQIVEIVGLSYPMRNVIDLFVDGVWSALRPAGRGRESGQGRLLSDEQEQMIQRAIIDKRPKQLKLDFYLWSRPAVAQLIEQEYVLTLSERTVAKNTSSAWDSRRKTRSRRLMSNGLKPSMPGWTSITL